MFFSDRVYATVPTISGLTQIYIDPHLPKITECQINAWCKMNDKYPGGVHVIEAARFLHYNDDYNDLLSRIRSSIKLFPNCVERHVTSDGGMNIDFDAIVIVEIKIDILSPFIQNFKIAEAYYNDVLVDPDCGTHENVDTRIFDHFEENKHKDNYLFVDAFVDVVMSYKRAIESECSD